MVFHNSLFSKFLILKLQKCFSTDVHLKLSNIKERFTSEVGIFKQLNLDNKAHCLSVKSANKRLNRAGQ